MEDISAFIINSTFFPLNVYPFWSLALTHSCHSYGLVTKVITEGSALSIFGGTSTSVAGEMPI